MHQSAATCCLPALLAECPHLLTALGPILWPHRLIL